MNICQLRRTVSLGEHSTWANIRVGEQYDTRDVEETIEYFGNVSNARKNIDIENSDSGEHSSRTR